MTTDISPAGARLSATAVTPLRTLDPDAPGDDLGRVLANGTTSLMGPWREMAAHLTWMREHNRGVPPAVGFYGIDLSGSNASLLPAVDALTAGIADLHARLTGRRREYVAATTPEAYQRAWRIVHLAAALDALARAMARGDQQGVMASREAAIADTVAWILRREDRVVLAAHNGHVQRWPAALPGFGVTAPMGLHLADHLGDAYRVIGVTNGTGATLNTGPGFFACEVFTELAAPEPGTLDALMAASHPGPFAVDLRRLPPADTRVVRAAGRQRFGGHHVELDPVQAYDAVVHLPVVTAATPDPAALAHTPVDVRNALHNHHR